jgi:Flp pilus assembly protein TadD
MVEPPVSREDDPPPEARDPARAAELAREATGALMRGELADAARLYRDATHADPGHGAAWRGLGLANERLGRAPEAVRAYRRYLSVASGAGDAGAIRERITRLEGG